MTFTVEKGFWITKLNTATDRRIKKLESEGVVETDTTTHQGRKQIGYCYLEYISE
jgi:hypothetical protein